MLRKFPMPFYLASVGSEKKFFLTVEIINVSIELLLRYLDRVWFGPSHSCKT